jgi:hypothetical protein
MIEKREQKVYFPEWAHAEKIRKKPLVFRSKKCIKNLDNSLKTLALKKNKENNLSFYLFGRRKYKKSNSIFS